MSLNNIATIDLAKPGGSTRPASDSVRAIAWQKKALAANPRNPHYRQFLTNHLTNLIEAARGLGDAEGVAEAERELAKLRDSDPAMVALDARLSAIIKGDQQPKDNADRLQLAQRAYDKALHATAARLWAEALAADPKLGDDRQAQHRYNAACAAALAGCGQGKDDPKPDDAAKAKLRKQALDWLKAELSAWKRVSMIVEPGNKELVAKTLAHWKQDSDLASIRDSPGTGEIARSGANRAQTTLERRRCAPDRRGEAQVVRRRRRPRWRLTSDTRSASSKTKWARDPQEQLSACLFPSPERDVEPLAEFVGDAAVFRRAGRHHGHSDALPWFDVGDSAGSITSTSNISTWCEPCSSSIVIPRPLTSHETSSGCRTTKSRSPVSLTRKG